MLFTLRVLWFKGCTATLAKCLFQLLHEQTDNSNEDSLCFCISFSFQHWSKWLPFFPRPEIRIFENEDTGKRPLVVNFPFQSFPAEKHAVDPDIHYILSSKTRIPEMGAPCPRYMSRDNYTLPCMIKTTQGVGGRGVFLARSKDQALEAFRELKTNFHCHEPVITEVVEDVSDFLNVQLYLFQNGDVHWLGVRRKMAGKSFCEHGLVPDVDWNEQEDLKKLACDVVKPVMKYLNKHGYFGFTGVEILINNRGKFLIDVNLKTSDSTYLLLLAPHIAETLNFPVSIVSDLLPTSIDAMLEEIDKLNCEDEGRVIVLSGDVTSFTKPIKSCIVVFAKDKDTVFLLHRRLIRSCASLICNGAGDHDQNLFSNGRVLLK